MKDKKAKNKELRELIDTVKEFVALIKNSPAFTEKIKKTKEVSPEIENLSEKEHLLRCFRAFLLKTYDEWKEGKEGNETSLKKLFVEKIDYNTNSLFYLIKHPLTKGVSIRKARMICQKLEITLEKALWEGEQEIIRD